MKALYPGTFDPITFGHIDVIERACKIFGCVTVAIFDNSRKRPLFNLQERKLLAQAALHRNPNVQIETFENQLLVDFANDSGANMIIRGLRAISDFENELSMAQTNAKIAPNIDTIFLMTDSCFSFLSSTMVKEIAHLGGDVAAFVPQNVAAALQQKFNLSKR